MRAGIILGAQLSDLAAFGLAVQAYGISGEANPAVGYIVANVGLLGLAVTKVIGAIAAAVIGPRLGRWWLVPAVVGLVGAATGLLVLL